MGSVPGSLPKSAATPVPAMTTPSQLTIAGLAPYANSENVIGPGARKNAQIQTTPPGSFSGTNLTTLSCNANPEPDLAGYAVVMRSTTSPVWEREIWVGNVTSYVLPDVSIDDVVIGVKAVDREGNQSVVSPYREPVLPGMLTPSTAK